MSKFCNTHIKERTNEEFLSWVKKQVMSYPKISKKILTLALRELNRRELRDYRSTIRIFLGKTKEERDFAEVGDALDERVGGS